MHLVPTARLELAQLSPLPPQDSVSTNFTTSAFLSQNLLHQETKILLFSAFSLHEESLTEQPSILA